MFLPLRTVPDPAVDPWRIELVVVAFSSHSGGERGAITRDTQRGLLRRIATGVYVDRVAYDSLSEEGRHVVRMRGLAATAPDTPVFSHWSAAVLHGIPVLRSRLGAVHVTATDTTMRHRAGVVAHAFPVRDGEVAPAHGLLVTTPGRTAVDIAGVSLLEEGAIAVDHLLRTGLDRGVLVDAIDRAGPRRAARRIAEAVAFGHPGAESAAETRMRVTSFRVGVEPPELQHRLRLPSGREAFLDAYYRSADAGLEVDGERKYLDPLLAPRGTEAALLDEKRRQDEVLLQVSRLARIGWAQAGDTSLLRPVLARIGVVPPRIRVAFDDYCAVARAAAPRRPH